MSWARDEWKDGLPHKALKKIEEIESDLERAKRDKIQKQYQIDSLQAMVDKQKQIAETERTQSVSSRREAQTLAENCENLERAKRKALQDLSQRDARYASLEDQLKKTKATLEAETNQKVQIKVVLDIWVRNYLTIILVGFCIVE
jgi:centromere protein F